MSKELIEIPEPIRAQLVETIEGCWFAPSERASTALAALPESMPEGEVQLIAQGGGFGMYIEARIDRVDGRVALECFSHNRMGGDLYFRIWDDGNREDLPGRAAVENSDLEYNDLLEAASIARGFGQFTTTAREINRYLERQGREAE